MALDALPAELLCLAATCLPVASLGQMRLSSYSIWAKTEPVFDNHILQTRWKVAEDSLATLLQLSREPRFSRKITTIRFSTHFLHQFTRPGKESGIVSLWQKLLRQQIGFLEGTRPAALLTLIFSQLPLLQSVEVGEWSSSGRELELGWGGAKLEKMTGQKLNWCMYHEAPGGERHDERHFYSSTLSQCTHLVLTALAVVGLPLNSLSFINLSEHDCIRGVEVPRTPTLDIGSPTAMGLSCAFANLTSLSLAVEYRHQNRPWAENIDTIHWLRNFLSLMPQLETLLLASKGIADEFDDDWRFDAYPEATQSFLQGVHFRRLKSFEFANDSCNGEDLYYFIKAHAESLERLILRRIQLRQHGQALRAWRDVFAELGTYRTMQLRSILLSYLYDGIGPALAFTTDGAQKCELCRHAPDREDDDIPIFAGNQGTHHTYSSDAGVLPSVPDQLEFERTPSPSSTDYGDFEME
ncbi:hypothetical protein LTS10_007280 [Elasticomyces elasticus]|nr:hypothetical protein LTS10_007280 [Elasticomyces elasticus]